MLAKCSIQPGVVAGSNWTHQAASDLQLYD